MAGKVGKAECHKCYIKFPKTEMTQVEVKGNKSGSSFSFGKKGNLRVHSGRQYYRKAWVCNDCKGGGCATFLTWCFLFGILIMIFGK